MKSWMVGYGESALELSRETWFQHVKPNSKLFTPEISTLLLDGEMVECSFVAFEKATNIVFAIGLFCSLYSLHRTASDKCTEEKNTYKFCPHLYTCCTLYMFDESSKVVVHFPCHGCLQIIVWMCVFLLF